MLTSKMQRKIFYKLTKADLDSDVMALPGRGTISRQVNTIGVVETRRITYRFDRQLIAINT